MDLFELNAKLTSAPEGSGGNWSMKVSTGVGGVVSTIHVYEAGAPIFPFGLVARTWKVRLPSVSPS